MSSVCLQEQPGIKNGSCELKGLTPSPPMPKLRSHNRLACSAVSTGSSLCRLSTCNAWLCRSTLLQAGTQTSRCSPLAGSWHTRMKSLPRPSYFAKSSCAARADICRQLLLGCVLLAAQWCGQVKHLPLGPTLLGSTSVGTGRGMCILLQHRSTRVQFSGPQRKEASCTWGG